MGPLRWKAVWRCASGTSGTQSVTQALITGMQVWLAGNLASPDTVSISDTLLRSLASHIYL